jgi:hypothetical protein
MSGPALPVHAAHRSERDLARLWQIGFAPVPGRPRLPPVAHVPTAGPVLGVPRDRGGHLLGFGFRAPCRRIPARVEARRVGAGAIPVLPGFSYRPPMNRPQARLHREPTRRGWRLATQRGGRVSQVHALARRLELPRSRLPRDTGCHQGREDPGPRERGLPGFLTGVPGCATGLREVLRPADDIAPGQPPRDSGCRTRAAGVDGSTINVHPGGHRLLTP